MRLNHKCVIDILEAVEKKSTYYDSFQYNASEKTPIELRKYTHDQIVYHIQYCDTAGYMEECSILGNGAMIIIKDLTPEGHTYLQNVRSKELIPTVKAVWHEKKKEGIGALICTIGKAIAHFFISHG